MFIKLYAFSHLTMNNDCQQDTINDRIEMCIRDSCKKKHPNLWQAGDWFFHRENAPAHTALNVKQFLIKIGMAPFSHPRIDLISPGVICFNFLEWTETYSKENISMVVKQRQQKHLKALTSLKSVWGLKKVWTRTDLWCILWRILKFQSVQKII